MVELSNSEGFPPMSEVITRIERIRDLVERWRRKKYIWQSPGFRSWWMGLPESQPVSCIVTHHPPQSGSSRAFMSLVFPHSTGMSKLLGVSLDRGALLVEKEEESSQSFIGSRGPHSVEQTAVGAGSSSRLHMYVFELKPEEWAKWRTRKHKRAYGTGSRRKGSTKVYIVKKGCQEPGPYKHKVVVQAQNLIEVFQELWKFEFSEEQHHKEPLNRLRNMGAACATSGEAAPTLPVLLPDENHMTGLPEMEIERAASTKEAALPTGNPGNLSLSVEFRFIEHRADGLEECGDITPCLVLDLEFEGHRVSTIRALLRARFTVGDPTADSAWGHDKLALSCACSSSPSAVSVEACQVFGLPDNDFLVRKRGINTQVKFVAESSDPPQLDHQQRTMALQATWIVLFHSPAPFEYQFSISRDLQMLAANTQLQQGMIPIGKPKNQSWTRNVTTSHQMAPWCQGLQLPTQH